MRRVALALSVMAAPLAAYAASNGYAEAERRFQSMPPHLRQFAQTLLVSAGYSVAIPTHDFSTRTFAAIQQFEADNGFVPNGLMDKGEVDRLVALASSRLAIWRLRAITLPGSAATLWVPFGLDIETRSTDKGIMFHDRQGRFDLRFVALRNVPGADAYTALLAKKIAAGTIIHFKKMKDDWFVVSATDADGTDHYYRYHQVGNDLVGFDMAWNNAAGNVSAERIAVLDSGVLAASVHGEAMIDPPAGARQEASREIAPAPSPAAPPPAAPPPAPHEKEGFQSGTGFFVSDDGHFVTNAHVVADCTTVMVKSDDGKVREAARTATDTTNDLAILKLDMGRDAGGKDEVPKRVAPLRLGARLGEGVEAFGYPHTDLLSTAGNFTLGNVTALAGLGDDTRYLQISAPVQAGNSGGPLLDGSGNLVGVVSMKLNAVKVAAATDDFMQNVNFAVKSAILASFLDANRVAYKTGTAGKAMEPADIADQARAMSGFVVCR